jgi:hypothetical protein
MTTEPQILRPAPAAVASFSKRRRVANAALRAAQRRWQIARDNGDLVGMRCARHEIRLIEGRVA